jgi:hypothetical protein
MSDSQIILAIVLLAAVALWYAWRQRRFANNIVASPAVWLTPIYLRWNTPTVDYASYVDASAMVH